MIMNAQPSRYGNFRGYQHQGSIEIAAPGALYADGFRRSKEKNPLRASAACGGRLRLGCKIDGERIKDRRRETVHRSGAAPAAAQWAPSYMRATWMQAPLAMVSLVCGVAVWLMSSSTGWLIAAVLIGLVVPFTFVVIMPTNKSLLLPGRDLNSPDTRALLERWGRLHLVRTALSLVATVLYLWLLSGA